MRRRRVAVALAAFAVVVPAATHAGTPPLLAFTTFVHTDLPLGQVTWTGREFLYLSESSGRIETSDASGGSLRPWATLELGGEEIRCATPPNRFWPDGVYCHTPDNRILRYARDGTSAVQLASLPPGQSSDGGLAFDPVGRFGYALLAATGGSSTSGGAVYAIRKDGRVQTIGTYPGPGGADEIAVAPATFGAQSGSVLLTIDEDHVQGRVLAIDRKGRVATVADGLGNGLNPIAVVPVAAAGPRPAGSPAAGLYVADTTSQDVLRATGPVGVPAGTVLVGAELTGQFWAIRPGASGGFDVSPVASSLTGRDWNLEGAVYVP